jgi:hypothetical protein
MDSLLRQICQGQCEKGRESIPQPNKLRKEGIRIRSQLYWLEEKCAP